MSTLETDTGELRRLVAQEIHRIECQPKRAVDMPLLGVALVAFVAFGGWALLILAPDHYPVPAGRVLLTLTACGSFTAPILGCIYGVSQANIRRHADLVDRIERLMRQLGTSLPASDDATVRDMTREAFRLGRRMGRNADEG